MEKRKAAPISDGAAQHLGEREMSCSCLASALSREEGWQSLRSRPPPTGARQQQANPSGQPRGSYRASVNRRVNL